MLDFFKNCRKNISEDEDDEPKKDKKFIAALIILGIMIAAEIIGRFSGYAADNLDYELRISIFDGIILGGAALAFVLSNLLGGE